MNQPVKYILRPLLFRIIPIIVVRRVNEQIVLVVPCNMYKIPIFFDNGHTSETLVEAFLHGTTHSICSFICLPKSTTRLKDLYLL